MRTFEFTYSNKLANLQILTIYESNCFYTFLLKFSFTQEIIHPSTVETHGHVVHRLKPEQELMVLCSKLEGLCDLILFQTKIHLAHIPMIKQIL